jgi:hypothetical protein
MANSNYTRIFIELKPHLVKYVSETLTDQRLIVKKSSDLGNYILSMLKDRPAKPIRPRKAPEAQPNELVLMICDRYTRDSSTGKFLPETAIDNIRRKLELMFRQDLRHYVRQQHLETNIEEKYALRAFMNRYNITEEDFSEESLYRDYNRWKKSKKIDA